MAQTNLYLYLSLITATVEYFINPHSEIGQSEMPKLYNCYL